MVSQKWKRSEKSWWQWGHAMFNWVSGGYSDNKFSDTEFSETNFPTPNYPTTTFFDGETFDRQIFRKVYIYFKH